MESFDKHGKKKDKKKDKNQVENSNFDEPTEPFPTKLKRDETTEYLFNDWWDFDDTRVNKFDINRMPKYFGNNKENAYILMYRRTSLNK